MKSISFLGRSLPSAPICLILLGACLWPEMELLVPSLPAMKAAFGVTDGDIQQLLTANFCGFLCGVLIAGGLCDSLGRKKTILWGMLFYLLSSYAAVFCDSFHWMMVIRFIQGLAVTAPIIGGATMLMDVTQGPQQLVWVSLSSSIITICMAGAPIIGAWINNYFGYKGNLWAIFLMGVLGGVPVLFVSETLEPEKRKTLQWKVLLKGYVTVATNKGFMILSVAMCIMAAAYWVYSGVSALYMVDYLHLDPSLFGKYQGPIVGTFSALSLFMSVIHKRWGLVRCLVAGFLAMALASVSMFILAFLKIEDALLTTILMMLFVSGMAPVNALLFPFAINLLPIDLQGSGQSLIQGIRLFFACIGTGILGIIYVGPFLPVSAILFAAFVLGWTCVWKSRKNLHEEQNNTLTVVSGH